tara:strand:- start:1 stop:267 length:267 start_codon:yes stop_codon:yes gene_type:complete
MRNLDNYINGKNKWNTWFGIAPLPLSEHLSQEDAAQIFDSIDCELSPENLTCDGEASLKDIQSKQNHLFGVAQDLMTLGFRKPDHVEF